MNRVRVHVMEALRASRHNRILLAILGMALALRLAALAVYSEVPQMRSFAVGGDAIGYTQLAGNLLSHGSFSFDLNSASAFRMPGYPLILAVTYAAWQTPLPTQLLQIAVDVLTVLIAYSLGKRLSGNSRVGLLAALVVAVNPLMIVSTVALNQETIAVFLISLGVLLLLQAPDCTRAGIGAALLFGMSVYLKPSLIAPVIVLLFLFSMHRGFTRRSKKALPALLLPFLVIAVLIAPWTARNWIVLQAFVPLTTSDGVNLYGGNNPEADGGYVSTEPYVLPDMSEIASDHEFTRRALDWIRDHPASFLSLLPSKAGRFFWPLSLGTSGYIAVPRPVNALVLAVLLAFYGLVLLGAGRLAATGQLWASAILLTPIMCLLLTSLITFGAARFALPAFPALAVLTALGVEGLLNLQRSPGQDALHNASG